MINTSGLAYTYPGQDKIAFGDLKILQGEHWLLLGESGSGKTTLLHLLGGLIRSQEGRIEVNGTNLGSLSESNLDHFRGRHFGFVFQKNHLISALTVKDNLRMAPFLAGMPQDPERLDHVLEQLGLGDKKHKKISQLSQGQAQRVAIARAVLNKPDVLIADEPTSSLDDRNCERVISLLIEASRQNYSTLVVATHDQRLKSIIKSQFQLG